MKLKCRTLRQPQPLWAKTLPERLEAHEQLLSARLDETKQIKGSLNALYAVLSQEQKKEADDIVLPMAGPWVNPTGGDYSFCSLPNSLKASSSALAQACRRRLVACASSPAAADCGQVADA